MGVSEAYALAQANAGFISVTRYFHIVGYLATISRPLGNSNMRHSYGEFGLQHETCLV